MKQPEPTEDKAVEDPYRVYITPGQNVSVAYVVNGFPVGIANADFVGNIHGHNRWWLARINLKETQGVRRGKGVGSEMMRRLQEALAKQDNFTDLLVTPGGYGSDEMKQIHFYVKNDFVPINEGGLVWKPKATK